MQDLLYGFTNPCIMDIKIGTRTFLEDDQDEKETKPRNDLYLRLIEIAPNEPTAKEHDMKAITKRRYMSWRERSTCSSTLGFRIEAIKVIKTKEENCFNLIN
jgi:1D-myo-inositol-triphosphate 3-kinase